ncbi:MAG TPA: 3-hydroxyacyl-ACP dehydratase FabZ [Elusimicrobiales bacterium]|nr:3-hydroxyacyl-ACP dehydratase FabZ [Elusimicrobiales bacterium]
MTVKEKDLSKLLTQQPVKELDTAQIMQTIPHRYPFLLIDKLKIIEDKKYAVGIKCVTVNEPFFKGHFPSKPVMPAVLILESMAQSCAAMMMTYPEYKNKIAYFMAIEKAKFRKPVFPGSVIETALEILRHGTMGKCRFASYVNKELVAQAQMSFVLEGK